MGDSMVPQATQTAKKIQNRRVAVKEQAEEARLTGNYRAVAIHCGE